ncbi:ABC transporter ATP-binding protein [Arsenicitalea aurantiaca]|uniref:ABC transporter ATP-binding protein n=1 Tax=Arsenicitalea aurantiaca TaxID=1783274 RepID=A0A433X8K1_9HYPH|nr:ABC transporter ATP-binding protein [Arsenicitalea aurantiaca]RUT30382.1 ABC transporter ATP-binding protein [Arsenicitalea aurantiaca]
MTTHLDVRGLTLTTQGRTLVSNLSFAIAPGERVGLIGESGSGKSLTAMAVSGLLPAAIRAQGSITLAGQEVIGAPGRVLDRLRGTEIAIVFQEPLTALDPLMRIGRQIGIPLSRRHRRDGRDLSGRALESEILGLLEKVRLPDPSRILRAHPWEISGGQRQRVAIAMALACRPKLLIADEPTTALDVTTQAEVLKLLDALVKELGMALLFISHDLPVVASIAERVIVLRSGEAVEAGPAGEVLVQPRHPYTQTLVEAARAFDDALSGGR